MTNRISGHLSPFISTVYAVVSLGLVWEAAGRIFQFHPQFLPTPSRIFLEAWDQAPRLRAHGLITACEILGGYLLAVACALPTAVLIRLTPGAGRIATHVLAILCPAPLMILTPLFFVWLGFGIRPEICIAFSLCFFVLTYGILTGLNSPAREMIELSQIMRLNRVQLFARVLLPASLPMMFRALRAAIPLAVVGATAGEFAQAEMGLGYVTLAASYKLETPMVFAGLTILGLIGLVLYLAVLALQSVLVPWHQDRYSL